MKLAHLICSVFFNKNDNIYFYMGTFRRNNTPIPYLTFRDSNQKEDSAKIYRILVYIYHAIFQKKHILQIIKTN